MDINNFRSLATILVMVAFFGVCWWAFSPSRRKQFDEAAQLPFVDEPNEQSDALNRAADADNTKELGRK
jgi:cytochrome c oxidase cbb3-type subunit 4